MIFSSKKIFIRFFTLLCNVCAFFIIELVYFFIALIVTTASPCYILLERKLSNYSEANIALSS